MSGILGALLGAASRLLLRTTITTGTDGVSTNGYNQGLFGSIGTATFTDASGNSRTIRILQWTGASIQLALDTINVPDSGATFNTILLTGPGGSVTLNRASRTSYNGTAGGSVYSLWTWTDATQPGTSGQSVTTVISG